MAAPRYKKIGPGNWRYRWKYKDKLTGEIREIKRQGFRTRSEAEHNFEIEKRKIELGIDTAENLILKEYLEFWLNVYKKDNVAKNTYILHKTILIIISFLILKIFY